MKTICDASEIYLFRNIYKSWKYTIIEPLPAESYISHKINAKWNPNDSF